VPLIAADRRDAKTCKWRAFNAGTTYGLAQAYQGRLAA